MNKRAVETTWEHTAIVRGRGTHIIIYCTVLSIGIVVCFHSDNVLIFADMPLLGRLVRSFTMVKASGVCLQCAFSLYTVNNTFYVCYKVNGISIQSIFYSHKYSIWTGPGHIRILSENNKSHSNIHTHTYLQLVRSYLLLRFNSKVVFTKIHVLQIPDIKTVFYL